MFKWLKDKETTKANEFEVKAAENATETARAQADKAARDVKDIQNKAAADNRAS